MVCWRDSDAIMSARLGGRLPFGIFGVDLVGCCSGATGPRSAFPHQTPPMQRHAESAGLSSSIRSNCIDAGSQNKRNGRILGPLSSERTERCGREKFNDPCLGRRHEARRDGRQLLIMKPQGVLNCNLPFFKQVPIVFGFPRTAH
jgi:hypothetical protein